MIKNVSHTENNTRFQKYMMRYRGIIATELTTVLNLLSLLLLKKDSVLKRLTKQRNECKSNYY